MFNVVKKPKYCKYEFQDWTQPVLTSNTSNSSFSFSDPSLSGGKFDETTEVMTWGSKSITGFSSIYKAFSSSTSDYFSLNAGAKTCTVFDISFANAIRVSQVYLKGNVVSGYASALTGSQIYSIDENGEAVLLSTVVNTSTNTHEIDNVVTNKLRICARTNTDGSSYRTRITQITITGDEKVAVESTKDDYDIIEYEPCLIKGKRTTTYQDFMQPVLTSNTSDPNFVVSTDLNKDGYKAFDSDTAIGVATHSSTGSYSNQNHWLQMKTKNGLNITNLAISNRGDISGKNAVTAGSVQVSNNGETWTKITDWTNDSTTCGSTWNIPLSYDGYYKYTRLYITSGYSDNSSNNIMLANIALTATEQVINEPIYVVEGV